MKPLAIDLFCGLGGWAEGLLAEDYDVVGFDIERHQYGAYQYPTQLVLQDVLTLQGTQFRDATLIVASPPCQFFSYTAMPWSRAKTLAAEVRAAPVRLEKELALFNACFRIQREACEAAGRHIPLVVENVRGAIPWVGGSRWNFGSFHLWGDVPALMPFTPRTPKIGGQDWNRFKQCSEVSPHWHMEALKVPGCKGIAHRSIGHWTNPSEGIRQTSSKSPARKAASALIAKIPIALSRHVAAIYRT